MSELPLYELKAETAREKANEFIDYLQYLADTLDAGMPVTRKPPGPPVEPKLFKDKVPEPGEVDLDGLLD